MMKMKKGWGIKEQYRTHYLSERKNIMNDDKIAIKLDEIIKAIKYTNDPRLKKPDYSSILFFNPPTFFHFHHFGFSPYNYTPAI